MLSKITRIVLFRESVNILVSACKISTRRQSALQNDSNIIKSVVPDIKISDCSVQEYIWRNLDKWHDKIATECAETGRRYTYMELYKRSCNFSKFLRKSLNLKPGSTVAIVLPNIPEYPIALLGVIQAGLKATLVNAVYTPGEIGRQLLDSDAQLVITLNGLCSQVKSATASIKNSKLPIVTISHQNNESTPPEVIKFSEISEGDGKYIFETQNTNDVVVLPYSSGTTGLPKGVECTHRNIVSNMHQIHTNEFMIQVETQGDRQDVVPAMLPMFHIYGLIVILLNMMSKGVKLVTIPKFGSEIFLKTLKNHQPTLAFIVPPIAIMLVNNPKFTTQNLSSIRTLTSGAAPLGGADVEKLAEKTKGKMCLLQGYGMTETCTVTHLQTNLLKHGIKLGGSGLLLPNTECKILSTSGDVNIALGPNEPGEITLCGPQIMKGYHNNKQATEEVLDENGWFRTGDIGHYDEDGHFYITDRIKELIKVKGFQVAPAELEEILRDHPDVEEAAVVGVPNRELGEAPKAFVVVRKGSNISVDKIKDYVASKVAPYKQLTGGVAFIDSVPKSASGKILRKELKNL